MGELTRKDIVLAVGEVLEQIVLPRLVNLEDGQKSIESTLKHHGELLEDHGRRLENIERKLDATVKLVDRQDARLDRLEEHTSLPPLTPASV